jgi:hypothetical protein
MKGVQLDSDGWLPVMAGKPDWMSTIVLYGPEEGWDALKVKNLSLDEHKALADGLAATVQKIHALWFEERRKQMAEGTLPGILRREPVRNLSKVGHTNCEMRSTQMRSPTLIVGLRRIATSLWPNFVASPQRMPACGCRRKGHTVGIFIDRFALHSRKSLLTEL